MIRFSIVLVSWQNTIPVTSYSASTDEQMPGWLKTVLVMS